MTSIQEIQIRQSSEVRQLGKSKQDHAAQGTYTDNGINTRWSAIWDGHGNNHSINFIRKGPLDEIMKSKTPADDLHAAIMADKSLSYRIKLDSGSTMVWVKEMEFPDHRKIEIGNVGDSQAILIVNDKVIFISKCHDILNNCEMERLFRQNRLNKMSPIIKKGTSIETISETELLSVNGYYLRFDNKKGDATDLACSQSLGHEDITGVFPDLTHFTLELSDSFRVLIFSDGITDVLPVNGLAMNSTLDLFMKSSPKDIVDEAERRWKQLWTLHNTTFRGKTQKCRFPADGYDDCVCAILEGVSLCALIDTDEMVEMSDEAFEQEELPIFDKTLIKPSTEEEEDMPESMESILKMASGMMSNKDPMMSLFSDIMGNPEALQSIMGMMNQEGSSETNPMKKLSELFMSGNNFPSADVDPADAPADASDTDADDTDADDTDDAPK